MNSFLEGFKSLSPDPPRTPVSPDPAEIHPGRSARRGNINQNIASHVVLRLGIAHRGARNSFIMPGSSHGDLNGTYLFDFPASPRPQGQDKGQGEIIPACEEEQRSRRIRAEELEGYATMGSL